MKKIFFVFFAAVFSPAVYAETLEMVTFLAQPVGIFEEVEVLSTTKVAKIGTLNFGVQPSSSPATITADTFVSSYGEGKEGIDRVTVEEEATLRLTGKDNKIDNLSFGKTASGTTPSLIGDTVKITTIQSQKNYPYKINTESLTVPDSITSSKVKFTDKMTITNTMVYTQGAYSGGSSYSLHWRKVHGVDASKYSVLTEVDIP